MERLIALKQLRNVQTALFWYGYYGGPINHESAPDLRRPIKELTTASRQWAPRAGRAPRLAVSEGGALLQRSYVGLSL
ncbi:MAG: hypothetical protein HY314_06190 [Acidobacteria bacterium]|nr:hypothetical protein [Acidobacteriota bacterium]